VTDRERLTEAFGLLVGQIQLLGNLSKTFEELFSNKRAVELLNLSAPSFFGEIERVYRGFFFIVAGRVTDPPRSQRGDANLSVARIYSGIKELGIDSDEIDDAFARISRFREIIRDYRNKMIAHADEKAVLSGGFSPEFGSDDIANFLAALQDFVDQCGRVLGDEGPYSVVPNGRPNHVPQLLEVLSIIDWEADKNKKRLERQRVIDSLLSLGSKSSNV